jgi:hypothetical protein
MRAVVVCLMLLAAPHATFAQDPPSDSTALCTFADQTQMSIHYQPVSGTKDLKTGTIWSPNNFPMNLFTQTPIRIANADIPVGAYSMFLIPGKKDWTLIINKNVTAGSPYDQKQDIVRAPMETGKLNDPTEFTVAFAHMAPKECHLRIYYGTTGAFAQFNQK